MLSITSYTQSQLEPYIPELARLRIQVFRDYPYLYDGDLEYEKRYLHTLLQARDSLVVLARDGEQIVGASTALPLSEETPEIQAPFIQAHYAIEEIFYCGESVLLPAYRGQGAGVAFFEVRERHMRNSGPYRWSCFCAVQRSLNHPARPADNMPLDQFWRNRGYQAQPELSTQMSWKEVGEAQESPKTMMFWMKALR